MARRFNKSEQGCARAVSDPRWQAVSLAAGGRPGSISPGRDRRQLAVELARRYGRIAGIGTSERRVEPCAGMPASPASLEAVLTAMRPNCIGCHLSTTTSGDRLRLVPAASLPSNGPELVPGSMPAPTEAPREPVPPAWHGPGRTNATDRPAARGHDHAAWRSRSCIVGNLRADARAPPCQRIGDDDFRGVSPDPSSPPTIRAGP